MGLMDDAEARRIAATFGRSLDAVGTTEGKATVNTYTVNEPSLTLPTPPSESSSPTPAAYSLQVGSFASELAILAKVREAWAAFGQRRATDMTGSDYQATLEYLERALRAALAP